MLYRGSDQREPFNEPAERNYWTPLILGDNRRKTTKKPTKLIGSFALLLAVPTGLEPAERNWLSVFFNEQNDCIVSVMVCQAPNEKSLMLASWR